MLTKASLLRGLFVAIVVISCCSTYAQNRYEIGAEGGLTTNYYRLHDAGKNLRNPKAHSAIAGINFRVNTRSKFYYETALLAMQYTFGLSLKQQTGYSVTNADDVIMLPLRVGYNAMLNSRFSFSPVVGAACVLKTLNADGMSVQNDPILPTIVPAVFYSMKPVDNLFVLGQLGADFNCRATKCIRLSLGINYYYGLINHAVYDVEYIIDNNSRQKAVVDARGNFINYNLALSYAFPHIRF